LLKERVPENSGSSYEKENQAKRRIISRISYCGVFAKRTDFEVSTERERERERAVALYYESNMRCDVLCGSARPFDEETSRVVAVRITPPYPCVP
jgi:hypothetical protein